MVLLLDSYDRAYQAEKILLEKSDLDSSDVENLYHPNLILNKKRQRKPVLISGVVANNSISEICINTDDDSSDDEDNSSKFDVIENPPPVPALENDKNQYNTSDGFIDENIVMNKNYITHEDELLLECGSSSNITDHNNIFNSNDPIEINGLDNKSPVKPIEQQIVVHENVGVAIATTADIKELKAIIMNQNALIENQSNKIDQLMAMVLELDKRGKKRRHSVEEFSQKNNDLDVTFSYSDLMLPLESLESVEKLEEMLKDDVIANHFVSQI